MSLDYEYAQYTEKDEEGSDYGLFGGTVLSSTSLNWLMETTKNLRVSGAPANIHVWME
jgi:hypothetical protein